jgi:hypothetical protein
MAKRDWKDWTKKACTRAIKTVAQAALAGLISLATSVYGLPEEKENEEG